MVTIDSKEKVNIAAIVKDKDKYQTAKTYIKLDKEKDINISVIKDFQKFTVDRLGNIVRIKKETERFSNKLKSNKQRMAERKARREKLEQEKQ